MSDLKNRQDHVIDLSKPTLEGLIYLLRHEELWPPGFKWDFQNCNTCAMGLFKRVWCGEPVGELNITSNECYTIGPVLGMSSGVSWWIFNTNNPNGKTTPGFIADRLEQWGPKHAEPSNKS